MPEERASDIALNYRRRREELTTRHFACYDFTWRYQAV